jgi:hypothetical protein
MTALTPHFPGLLLLVASAVLGCARASEPALESPAEYCRRAVDLLNSPVSDSAYRNALPMLYSCPKEGGALLARLWEAPPSNDTMRISLGSNPRKGTLVFTESAELYDLIYSRFKDYRPESARVAPLLRSIQ